MLRCSKIDQTEWPGSGVIRPLPRPMLDEQNFNLSVFHPVGDDVGCAGNHQLTGTFDLTNTPDEWVG